MVRLYNICESAQWDECMKSFSQWDVYYLSGYVKAFHIHGDGDPYLFYYEEDGLRAIYVYMRRETALKDVYDSTTPYGYGGVLFEGDLSSDHLTHFWHTFVQTMHEEHIVDNFVRYHPVLRNADPMKAISPVIDMGKTVAIDLDSPEVIWDNITSKNRNMIRKAEKNGIEICHGKSLELLEQFRQIYNQTMEHVQAEDYYFFGPAFYESMYKDLADNYDLFYAVLDGQIIAISIMLYGNRQMHYHLSGSLSEYRSLAPSNLLLYKAALWGYEHGFKTFHLGGGVGSEDDNLYKFKAAFNKKSDYHFSIGKQIFDQHTYDELVKKCLSSDPQLDTNSSYFPVYRSNH